MQARSQSYPAWGQPLLGGPPYTADDVERLPDDGYRYEVYRGKLIRLPVGDQEVWIVWPKSRTVDVWTANTTTVYTDQQDITSAHLPGWSCPVRQFFEG